MKHHVFSTKSFRRRLIRVGLVFVAIVIVAAGLLSHELKLLAIAGQTSSLPRYGIAAGSALPQMPPDQLDSYMSGIESSGAGWVRFDFDWSSIQPDSAHDYAWTDYDRVVAAATAHHLKIVGIIDFTPTWARVNDCQDQKQCRPVDAGQFGTFSSTLASRYSGQGVHVWEIWNEANTDTFFKPAPNVAQYARLLISAYQHIHAVDSNAIVISAGTAPAATNAHSISPVDFLTGLYREDAGNSFDAVGAHPYTYPLVPSNTSVQAWSQLAAGTQNLRSIMTNNHDTLKKIWITEFGSPTGGPGPTSTASAPLLNQGPTHVDEALSAQSLEAALKLYNAAPWAGPFFYYSYQDNGTTNDTNENFFGLIRADGTHKPAYQIFDAAARAK